MNGFSCSARIRVPETPGGYYLAAVKTLLSWLALLFHLLFCLSIMSLGVFGFATGAGHLPLEMLPWSGSILAEILLFGLLTVILAIVGKLRCAWIAAMERFSECAPCPLRGLIGTG